jgi:hypothetical protein
MTKKDLYSQYKYHRWWFPMKYFRYKNYSCEVTIQATCCICLEQHDYYDCNICRICKDGIICDDCFYSYEDTDNAYSIECDVIPSCPLCRTVFRQRCLNNLIKRALSKYSDIPTPNNLYRRWIYNYMISDEYQFGRFDVDDCYIHRKYQLKVTRDIKRIKVNKDIKNQIKKYNVKMAPKDLKYKLDCEEWKKHALNSKQTKTASKQTNTAYKIFRVPDNITLTIYTEIDNIIR